MPYTAEISRSNPTCFLFLIDQSRSMAERFGGDLAKTKAQGVAEAINRLLETLVTRCSKGDYIADRYYIGAIGYGGDVSLGFPINALAAEVLQPVSLIDAHPLRIEQQMLPVWLEPKAAGKTPMCQALQAAHEVIYRFVAEHPGCFPPLVINISDGMATDGDAARVMAMGTALRSVASQDGNALLFNVHLSVRGQPPILFPIDETNLPDEYARLLFRMSSPLPQAMLQQARILQYAVPDGAVGFAFNADLASVIMFLDIGTKGDRITT
jgi:hypothetical protein